MDQGTVTADLLTAGTGQGSSFALSSHQLARLESGLPDLARLSPKLLVPFAVRRVEGSKVAWLNGRWCMERGFHPDDPATRAKLEAWLLAEFAFTVEESDGQSVPAETEARIFHADRYGSTAGASPHGGSGRVATVGRFQVKGIGATPLVGATRTRGHAHGCLSLAEALREAILSEIMAAEFPHSATPVVAVIAIGQAFSSPDVTERFDQDVPRALLIRPAVVRAAHMERASGFRVAFDGTPQHPADDIQRVRDVADAWGEGASSTAERRAMLPLPELVTNIARQIGYGHAHRISFGGVFTSNLGGCGQLVDFGNVHFLPDWSHALVLPHVPGFGAEMMGLRAAIRSMSAVSRAHRVGGAESDAVALVALAQDAYRKQLDTEWKRLWGRESASDQWIAEAMREYVAGQQTQRVLYRFGERVSSTERGADQTTLHQALVDYSSGSHTQRSAMSKEDALVASMAARLPARNLAVARHWMRPRTSVDRAKMLHESHAECRCDVEPALMSRYIDGAINGARRDWRALPNGWPIDAHVHYEGSSAVWCRDLLGRCRLWLEGSQENGRLWLFGQQLEGGMAFRPEVTNDATRWHALLPVDENLEATQDQVELHGNLIRLPDTPVVRHS